MSYYLELDSQTRDKVKVLLDLSNFATKKELERGRGVVAKSDNIALKADVDKLDINELVNVSAILNELKSNVDDLDDDKLITLLIYLKKLSAIVSRDVVKNKTFNTKNEKSK